MNPVCPPVEPGLDQARLGRPRGVADEALEGRHGPSGSARAACCFASPSAAVRYDSDPTCKERN